MKSIHSLLAILIQLLMAGSLMSQANITLTFTANMDAQHQTLDSVVILNFTRGGDTVLIYPDTVLLLVDQGIQVFDPDGDHNKGLILHPAFPNPFSGQTTSRFFLPERDVVTIRIIDLLGREVIAYQQTLSAGEHIFNLYPGRERQYLLVVETSRDKRVQKLISMGGGSAFRIEHRASYASFYGFRKGKSGFPWVPGDQLEFIGYATLMGSIMAGDTIPDDPVLSSLYTFQFLGLPVQPSPIQGDTIPCENQTGLQYSVVQQPWVMYTWSVPGGWTIVTGQGTHEITVTAGVPSGVIEVLPTNITGQGPTQTLAVSTQFCPYPPGYVHCNPLGPTLIIDVINPATAKTWMDRNLGASNQMASYNDPGSYGDLFQWGRFADGHQCRTSNTTYLVSTTDQPGHGNFIWGINLQGDWRSPQNDNLWQGVHGVSNPCPMGYRIPTMAEWNQERLS